MSQPTAYARLYSFTDWQTVNPTKPLPGSELDAELNSIKANSDQVLTNLALIQRDDGKLANQTVTAESMSASALALILQGNYNPRGAWAASVVYAVGDLAEFNSATYLCLIAHTSTASFATDKVTKWLLIANGALSGGATTVELFSGTGSQTVFNLATSYTNVNSAVVFVSGVAQIPTQNFTLSGTVLTFITAPPAPSVGGQKNVMVRGTGVEAQLAVDNAATQAANALGYANAASASSSAATASQASALASQNSATASASTATTQAGIATNQATTSTTQAGISTAQASTATTQAGISTTQAGIATSQATTATTQATNAATSASTATAGATTATTQAGIATAQATTSTTQASNAGTSAAAALASLNLFKGQYYGVLASNPTLDPLGAAIGAGDLYFNSAATQMRVYDGAAWVAAYVPMAVASITSGTIDGATIGATTPSTGAFTTLSVSSTLSGAGVTAYFASPPAIGTTAAAEVKATTGWAANLALTDAATVAWNTATSQVATFTFVSTNRTMGAPTNLKNGAFFALAVIQNAGSNTLTWNTVFKWAAGTAPTLSTAAGAKDYFTFRSDGTNLYQQGISQAVA